MPQTFDIITIKYKMIDQLHLLRCNGSHISNFVIIISFAKEFCNINYFILYLQLYSLKLFSYIFYLGYFIDSCKDKDKELSPLIQNANSPREYFRILKEKELFTPSDVIFMQFLLRESNCGTLNEKCIAYAKTQKALCFYEEPPSKYSLWSSVR